MGEVIVGHLVSVATSTRNIAVGYHSTPYSVSMLIDSFIEDYPFLYHHISLEGYRIQNIIILYNEILVL